MPDGTPLTRFTEKEVANMSATYLPKSKELAFTTNSENTVTLDNPTSYFEMFADFDLFWSLEPSGTATASIHRHFQEANARLRQPFGSFTDKIYIRNVTGGAGVGKTVYFKYRD